VAKESTIIAKVMIEATQNGWRLFRNSVGLAWQGRKTGEIVGREGLQTVLADCRRVKYGLAKGSSDLIGWRQVVITPDMVGQTIAQFVSVEVKTREYSKITPEQDNWLHQVAAAAGYSAVAHEAGDHVEIIKYCV
jgi:CRISPR/Cas system-associated exonuclease Cas4 (RecB family)